MTQWTFITNHGAVLALVTRHDHITIREIAARLELTERPIRRILIDLEQAGYLRKQRTGRSNQYEVNPYLPLRRSKVHSATVGELIQTLNGWTGSR